MMLENQRITFFDFNKISRRLDDIYKRINPKLDNPELYDLIRSMQSLEVSVAIGKDKQRYPAKLDPTIKEGLRLVQDDPVEQATILQLGPLEKLIHIMWDGEDGTPITSCHSYEEKMVFASKKFICLWTIISKFGEIQISVPCFDEVFINFLSRNKLRPDVYRHEVQRKKKLVAYGLLESFVWHLHNTFLELIFILDQVAEDNQKSENRACASRGNEKKNLRPKRALRRCLVAIIDTIDNNPLAWPSGNGESDILFRSLRDDLQTAAIDLSNQFALYECYAGHVTETAAVCKHSIFRFMHTVKRNTQVSVKKLRCNLSVQAFTPDDYAGNLGHDIEAFSSSRDALEVLSAKYTELEPLGPTVELYHGRVMSSTPEQDAGEGDTAAQDSTTERGIIGLFDSQTASSSSAATQSAYSFVPISIPKSSEDIHTMTDPTTTWDSDFDMQSYIHGHLPTPKRPVRSSSSLSSLCSAGKSRPGTLRSKSSKRTKTSGNHGTSDDPEQPVTAAADIIDGDRTSFSSSEYSQSWTS